MDSSSVVDPGDDEHEIIKLIDDFGGNLKYILLTHAHHDHIYSVSAIAERYKISFYLHSADKGLLRQAPLYAMSLDKRKIKVPQNPLFIDDASLYFGGQLIRYMHLPGHTSGSVCYLWGGAIFTGDTLLYEEIGRSDLPGGSPLLLNESIEKLKNILKNEDVLFPGHNNYWLADSAREWLNLNYNICKEDCKS
ncbi:MBL fold metallo-hydrolase [Polynucleobacter bastaniensis]|uniref:MBL fold metallo-hydrolase n=1 Tax=Polynucleobacter bastaniensis TaxID=2081039 RepID=UPI001C0C6667|nr:MBL fold metallo-hydrolase [Polynucleobacter bastaniensis]